MDLQPSFNDEGRGTFELRSFRAVTDGPAFCWDLICAVSSDGVLELPEVLAEVEAAVGAAVGGGPAFSVRANLDDRVFVSAMVIDALEGEIGLWVNDLPGWLRWVRLTAKPDSCEIVWCVRIEGGAELGTPIARAWTRYSAIRTTAAQGTLPLEGDKTSRSKPLRVVNDLPPEVDDEGHPVVDDEPIKLTPRGRGKRK